MLQIRKLLFPVDLSAVSSEIALSVIAFGKTFDAEIHLLHVAVTMQEVAGVYGPGTSTGDIVRDIRRAVLGETAE